MLTRRVCAGGCAGLCSCDESYWTAGDDYGRGVRKSRAGAEVIGDSARRGSFMGPSVRDGECGFERMAACAAKGDPGAPRKMASRVAKQWQCVTSLCVNGAAESLTMAGSEWGSRPRLKLEAEAEVAHGRVFGGRCARSAVGRSTLLEVRSSASWAPIRHVHVSFAVRLARSFSCHRQARPCLDSRIHVVGGGAGNAWPSYNTPFRRKRCAMLDRRLSTARFHCLMGAGEAHKAR